MSREMLRSFTFAFCFGEQILLCKDVSFKLLFFFQILPFSDLKMWWVLNVGIVNTVFLINVIAYNIYFVIELFHEITCNPLSHIPIRFKVHIFHVGYELQQSRKCYRMALSIASGIEQWLCAVICNGPNSRAKPGQYRTWSVWRLLSPAVTGTQEQPCVQINQHSWALLKL